MPRERRPARPRARTRWRLRARAAYRVQQDTARTRHYSTLGVSAGTRQRSLCIISCPSNGACMKANSVLPMLSFLSRNVIALALLSLTNVLRHYVAHIHHERAKYLARSCLPTGIMHLCNLV